MSTKDDQDDYHEETSRRRELAQKIKSRRKDIGLRSVEALREYLEKRNVSTSVKTLRRLESAQKIRCEMCDAILIALELEKFVKLSDERSIEEFALRARHGINEIHENQEQDILRSTLIGTPTVQTLSFENQLKSTLNKFKFSLPLKGEQVEWQFPDPIKLSRSHLEFVTGPAGRGKSTLMKASFLSLLNEYRLVKEQAPLFYRATDYKLAILQTKQLLQRQKSLHILLFIDGVDEIEIENQVKLFSSLDQLDKIRCAVVLSARTELIWRLHTEKWPIANKISSLIEINEWDYESDTITYVKKYAQSVGKPHIIEAFERLGKIGGAKALLQKPINVIVMIYLIQHSKIRSSHTENVTELYELFNKFYEVWLERESLRSPSTVSSNISSTEIEEQHEEIAIHFFLRPYLEYELSRLRSKERILNESAFSNLLIFNLDHRKQPRSIRGFNDDSFVDFLSARKLVKAISSNDIERAVEALCVEYNNNANIFIRSHFQTAAAPQKKNYTEILSRVLEIAANRDATIAAEQAIYYLGRVGAETEPKILTQVYKEEKNPLIRRSAALGAILYGNINIEIDYCNLIMNDPEEDLLNRSVQLLYFEDTYGSIFERLDDQRCSWDRTRKTIFERIQIEEERARRLRAWDLSTLYCFQRTRTQVILTDLEIRWLENSQYHDNFDVHRDYFIRALIYKILDINSKRHIG